MFRKLIKFIRLPWPEKCLYTEAFYLTGVVRLAILLLPFRWLAPHLGQHMVESPQEEDAAAIEAARRVGLAVETVSRHSPWESKCLVQAIAGKILLRRRGIGSTLYLGVDRDDAKILIAHAWLRCGGLVLTGGQGREHFTVVGKFGDDGRRGRAGS
ncbi:lasso peptide biosynthesis B2 protein [Pelotomaculum propionicicum]|uniref:lasso peptide biosynthesis B2 protein n=1 Tax=Pelotomaculum propionicicum TaxID=258475 RepID=UPI003B7BBF7F